MGTAVLAVLVFATGAAELLTLTIARADVFVVLPGDHAFGAATAGTALWVPSFILGCCALILLSSGRRRRAWPTVSALGVWGLVSFGTGALLLLAGLGSGLGAVLDGRVDEARTSPSTACSIVLRETATFTQTTESLYVVHAFGVGGFDRATTIQDGRPLRAGRVAVSWESEGGVVSYQDEGARRVTLFGFTCRP